MSKIGRFFKFAGKWLLILGGIYLASLYFSGLDFETRTGWFLFGLALAVGYVDGTTKDRIGFLEARIESLEKELYGPYR